MLVTHHLEKQIIFFAQEKFGHIFDLTFVHQPALDGSAGALKSARPIIEREDAPYFLVCAADYRLTANYLLDFIDFHIKGSHDLSIALRLVPAAQSGESNITRLDGAGRIVSLTEKPSAAGRRETVTAAYLLYVLPKEAIGMIDEIRLSERNEYELTDVINMLIGENYIARGFLQSPLPCWEEAYKTGHRAERR